MQVQHWLVAAIVVSLLAYQPFKMHAQDSVVCEQNAQYWERWEQMATTAAFAADFTPPEFDLAPSPNGDVLAVANRNSLMLYDMQTLTLEAQLVSTDIIPGGNYKAIAWSPDGSQLAAAYYVFDDPDSPNLANGIQIWDVEQKQQVDLLAGRPQAMAWSPDSSILAEADALSGDIWLWDVTRGISSKLSESRIGVKRTRKPLMEADKSVQPHGRATCESGQNAAETGSTCAVLCRDDE